MCSPIRCANCGKTTWAGCGQHVDQVMSRVAERERCTCRDRERSAGSRRSLLALMFDR